MKYDHTIPMGTHVSFKGDAIVYETADYSEVVMPCGPDCSLDHDHYTEPCIMVHQTIGYHRPLSKLQHIFDPLTHVGRPATDVEKTPVPR